MALFFTKCWSMHLLDAFPSLQKWVTKNEHGKQNANFFFTNSFAGWSLHIVVNLLDNYLKEWGYYRRLLYSGTDPVRTCHGQNW